MPMEIQILVHQTTTTGWLGESFYFITGFIIKHTLRYILDNSEQEILRSKQNLYCPYATTHTVEINIIIHISARGLCRRTSQGYQLRRIIRTGTGRFRVSHWLGVIQRSFTSHVRSTLSEFIHITEQQLSLDSPCCFAGRDPLHRTIWRHATIRWLILSPCSIAKWRAY